MLAAIYLETDHVLEIPELTNGLTGVVVSGATVSATLYGADGDTVKGQSWPLLLAEDSETPGRYSGTLSATLDLEERARYSAHVEADAGVGLKRTWHVPVVAQRGT